jgi:hypothetical protein
MSRTTKSGVTIALAAAVLILGGQSSAPVAQTKDGQTSCKPSGNSCRHHGDGTC